MIATDGAPALVTGEITATTTGDLVHSSAASRYYPLIHPKIPVVPPLDTVVFSVEQQRRGKAARHKGEMRNPGRNALLAAAYEALQTVSATVEHATVLQDLCAG